MSCIISSTEDFSDYFGGHLTFSDIVTSFDQESSERLTMKIKNLSKDNSFGTTICDLPQHLIETVCKILISSDKNDDFRSCFRDILSLRSSCKLLYNYVNSSILSFPLDISSENSHLFVQNSRFCKFLQKVSNETCWGFSYMKITLPKEYAGYEWVDYDEFILITQESKFDIFALQLQPFFEEFEVLFSESLRKIEFVLFEDVNASLINFLFCISRNLMNNNTVLSWNMPSRAGVLNIDMLPMRQSVTELRLNQFSFLEAPKVGSFKNLTSLRMPKYKELQLPEIKMLENLTLLDVGGIFTVTAAKSKIVFDRMRILKITKQRFANSHLLGDIIRISFPNLVSFHFSRKQDSFENEMSFKDLPKSCEIIWTNCYLMKYFVDCPSIRCLHVESLGLDQELLPLDILDSAQFSLKTLSVHFSEMNYGSNPDGPILGNVEQILVFHPELKVLSISSPHYEIYVESDIVQIWLDKKKNFLRDHSMQLMIFCEEIVVMKNCINENLIRLIDKLDGDFGFAVRNRIELECSCDDIQNKWKLELEASLFTYQW